MIECQPYRGRLTTVTPTRRRIGGEYPVVRPAPNYIILPEFAIANNWFGVSTIIQRFVYNIPGHTILSLTKILRPLAPEYLAVVSYESNGVKIRYKLWEDDEVLLYVEDYVGQRIPNNFNIEVWSKNENPVVNYDDLTILTSLLSFPVWTRTGVGTEIGTRRACTDNIFDISLPFLPANGDFWSFDNCGVGTLTTYPDATPPIHLNGIYWLLNTTDGLYYEVKLYNDGGLITLDVQTQSDPPFAGSPHLLLRADTGTSHQMTLQTDGGEVVPDINQTPTTGFGALSVNLIEPISGNYHTFSLIEDGGEITYAINQTPNP